MSTEHTPRAALEALHAALTHLRALASDPFYAQAAEQVAAIVAGLEGHGAPTPKVTSGIPDPPSPGIAAPGRPD